MRRDHRSLTGRTSGVIRLTKMAKHAMESLRTRELKSGQKNGGPSLATEPKLSQNLKKCQFW